MSKRGGGQQGDALEPHVSDLRKALEAVDEARVVEASDHDLDVLGPGGLEQAGIGGIGTAAADRGSHYGPGGHADQEGESQQGTPASP